jgi:GAF domain-containing protein
MKERLCKQSGLNSVLNCILADTIALLGGEFGDLQLRRDDGVLVLVAQCRLPKWFVESLGHGAPDDGTVCARAVKAQKTVIVSDVEKDDLFRPFVSFARIVRFKSVLSSPLISRGVCIGVVSVHFANHCSPSPVEISTLEEYCKVAADALLDRINGAGLDEISETLYKQLLAENKLATANRA